MVVGPAGAPLTGRSSWSGRTARWAELRQPGQPDRLVALARREARDCIAEELRRLDPDEIYAAALRRDRPGRAEGRDARRGCPARGRRVMAGRP